MEKVQTFLDFRTLRTSGGTGGDGCISFLSLWSNEFAGPDGGDGGNGGHVIFKSSGNINDLHHVPVLAKANNGEKGTVLLFVKVILYYFSVFKKVKIKIAMEKMPII